MPSFEPDKWNQPDVISVNNCYNYVANDLHKPQPGKDAPQPAEPGNTQDITAEKLVGITPQGVILVDFTCKGLKAAAKADGFQEPDATGKCKDNCWRVAIFVKRYKKGRPIQPGNYHFVREDSPGKWSHKPGKNPATDQQYNPATKKYDGVLLLILRPKTAEKALSSAPVTSAVVLNRQ